ncbi:MAG: helix-turn-helix transcriptional regulator [Clostridia bacterium]|nr:helix-turn-helix transcriptional regulator [Clostridia bacterium]
MKSFYESLHENRTTPHFYNNPSRAFAPHYHINMEILLVRSGCYNISINENHYTVTNGCIAVIDSYDIHSYDATKKSLPNTDAKLVLIPYEYLKRFHAHKGNLKITTPVLHDESLCERLFSIAHDYMQIENSEATRIAGTELFLALLSDVLTFSTVDAKSSNGVLTRDILAYIAEHFRENITRTSIAHALGYSETYISHAFHQYIQMSISEYVNEQRLDYVEQLLREGDKRSLIEIIYEAGFNSQQTYYRAKNKAKNK